MPQPADPTAAFTAVYDAWNRLVLLSDADGTVQENAYDARGFRTVRKLYSAGALTETRHFYYDSDWRCLEERLNGATTADRQYVWGLRYIDDLVLRDRDTTGDGTLDERLYALQDANWNVVALTDTAGNVQERYAYDAYGTPSVLNADFTIKANTPYDWQTLFCGYRSDPTVGLYHVRFRVYHPRLGTWVSRDPALYADGTGLLQYVMSNPLRGIDPMGLQQLPLLPPPPGPRQPGNPLEDWCPDNLAQHLCFLEESWNPSLCNKFPPCPCSGTKVGQADVTEEQYKKMFDKLKKQAGVTCPVELVVKDQCVDGLPGFGITCSIGTRFAPASVICIPKKGRDPETGESKALNYCEAQAQLRHELEHSQQICGKRPIKEPSAYRRQCELLQSQQCPDNPNSPSRKRELNDCVRRLTPQSTNPANTALISVTCERLKNEVGR